MITGQLVYDEEYKRFEIDNHGLHCGDCLSVLIVDGIDNKPKWIDTSIEINVNGEWYLTGLIGYQISGLFAKMGY